MPDSTWQYKTMDEILPFQLHDSDEGVKIIQVMNHLSLRSANIKFKEEKIEEKRKKILYAIATKTLLH